MECSGSWSSQPRLLPLGNRIDVDLPLGLKPKKLIKEKELSARLLKLQDEERRRIARELHDGVGQLLAAMSMNASRIERREVESQPRCGTMRGGELQAD